MHILDRRLLQRARVVRVLLAVDVAIGLVAALLVLLQATLLADIVARGFGGASAASLTPQLALLAAAFVGRGLAAGSFEVAGIRAASTVLSELRLTLAAQRLRVRPLSADTIEAGELGAAGVQGVDGLEAYFGRYLPQVVLACVVPVAVLAAVAFVDPESALIMLATLPLVPVFMWLIGRYAEERARERWRVLRSLSGHFLDVVRGLPTLRAYNRGGPQAEAIADVTERYRRATMGTLRVAFLSGSVLELAATLGVALVAVTIGVRLVDGDIAFRAGLTVLVLAPELYLPLRQLGTRFHASADGIAAADLILSLLDDPAATPAAKARLAPSPAIAAVRLEKVSFTYPSRDALVLDELDLELQPGETVALVGKSGSGKSTVASLLLALAAPASGRVTVGGVDLAACDAAAWRRSVAWVPQHPTIFHASAADNIRFGNAGAGDEKVRRAARLAGADDFLSALPGGYGTVLGDGGRGLSAGERRRVALARAFLRDAPFVVLDEPTADLDPESASLVAAAVDSLCERRTVLVIAHRPELIARADRVVLLERGRVRTGESREAA